MMVVKGFGLSCGRVRWRNEILGSGNSRSRDKEDKEVTWVYQLDGSGSVWAVFEGKVLGNEAVEAQLMVDYVL